MYSQVILLPMIFVPISKNGDYYRGWMKPLTRWKKQPLKNIKCVVSVKMIMGRGGGNILGFIIILIIIIVIIGRGRGGGRGGYDEPERVRRLVDPGMFPGGGSWGRGGGFGWWRLRRRRRLGVALAGFGGGSSGGGWQQAVDGKPGI
jgi:uncharacterized protein